LVPTLNPRIVVAAGAVGPWRMGAEMIDLTAEAP
jgi:hypothetical protein